MPFVSTLKLTNSSLSLSFIETNFQCHRKTKAKSLELAVTADMEIEMNRKPCQTKKKPRLLMKETFDLTKKFFHKTFRNLKFLFLRRCQNLPKTSSANPILSLGKINSKLQELDKFYRSLSEKWDTNEVVKEDEGLISPKEQTRDEGDEQSSICSISVGDYSRFDDFKEEKKARKCLERKQDESSFMAAEALAQKMKELEMMDVNDLDHVLDIAEVLHYYSRLTCPAYLEMVDKFFMDMYSELSLSQLSRSRNGSMRKVAPESVQSLMRSLGP